MSGESWKPQAANDNFKKPEQVDKRHEGTQKEKFTTALDVFISENESFLQENFRGDVLRRISKSVMAYEFNANPNETGLYRAIEGLYDEFSKPQTNEIRVRKLLIEIKDALAAFTETDETNVVRMSR